MAELLARVNFPGKSTPLVIADAVLTPARIAFGYENITYAKSESASQDKKCQIVQAEKVKNVALRGLIGVVACTILLVPTLIALLVKYAFIGPQNEFLSKQGKTAESTQKTAENRLPPKPPGDAKLDEKKAKEPNSVVHPTPPSSKPTSQSEPRAHAPSAQPARPILSEKPNSFPTSQTAIDASRVASTATTVNSENISRARAHTSTATLSSAVRQAEPATSASVSNAQSQGPSAAPARVETKAPVQRIDARTAVNNLYKMIDDSNTPQDDQKLRDVLRAFPQYSNEWAHLVRDYKDMVLATKKTPNELPDYALQDYIWNSFPESIRQLRQAFANLNKNETPSVSAAQGQTPTAPAQRVETKVSTPSKTPREKVIDWYQKLSGPFANLDSLYEQYQRMDRETQAIIFNDWKEINSKWRFMPPEMIKKEFDTRLGDNCRNGMRGWEDLPAVKAALPSAPDIQTEISSINAEPTESKKPALQEPTATDGIVITWYKEAEKAELSKDLKDKFQARFGSNGPFLEIFIRDYRRINPKPALTDQQILRLINGDPREAKWRKAYEGYNLGE